MIEQHFLIERGSVLIQTFRAARLPQGFCDQGHTDRRSVMKLGNLDISRDQSKITGGWPSEMSFFQNTMAYKSRNSF